MELMKFDIRNFLFHDSLFKIAEVEGFEPPEP